MAKRARIANDELEYLETVLASTVGAGRLVKVLAFQVTQPEELELCSRIMADLATIRTTTITWMDKRRQEELKRKEAV